MQEVKDESRKSTEATKGRPTSRRYCEKWEIGAVRKRRSGSTSCRVVACDYESSAYWFAEAINCATIFLVSSSIASIGFFEPFEAVIPLIPTYTASYAVSPRFSTR